MSLVHRYRARIPDVDELVAAAGFVVLVLLSETYHLSFSRATLVPLLGWSIGGLLFLYLAVGAVVVALSSAFVAKELAASLPVAVVFYALISLKSLAIDADFLGTWTERLAFGLWSAFFLGALVLARRRLRTGLAVFVLVLAYANALKWLQRGWVARGGNVTAYLTSRASLTIVGVALLVGVSVLVGLHYLPRRRFSGGMAAALGVFSILGIARQSERPPMTLGTRVRTKGEAADLYVLSFDALRKDAFDEQCARAPSDPWRRLCERSTRFDNVLSAGLQTHAILQRNIDFDRSCDSSLPGRLRQRGYATTMFFGSRQRTIPGWRCFDHFYSGDGAQLFGHFSLPSVAELLGPQAPRLRFKFLETASVLAAVRADQTLTELPLFAYLHVLDLHAPYVSRARWTDARYLGATLPEFMSRCYLGACDTGNEAHRQLVEQARAAYLESVGDLGAHLAEVFRIAEQRNRPFRLVVTADHGELFGEHGAFAHGGGFVPELLSVPFAVYDSANPRGSRDCRLLTTADALALVTEPSSAAPRAASDRVAIDGSPLGRAVVDGTSRTITYTIADEYVRHRKTWRNLHESAAGTVPWEPARCGPSP